MSDFNLNVDSIPPKDFGRIIFNSELWAVFRLDKKGNMHLHTKDINDAMALISHFFSMQPELYEMLQDYIEAHQRGETEDQTTN